MNALSIETPAAKSGILGRVLFVVVLLCLLVGSHLGPVPKYLSNRMGMEVGVPWLLAGFVISFGIIIMVALRLDGKNLGEIGQWLSEMGLGRPTHWPAIVVGALVGVIWAALFMFSILQVNPETDVMQISIYRVVVAVVHAGVALMEEILGRGYLMNRLNQIAVPNWGQVLLAALVFAVYHTIWAFNIDGFIVSLVFGLILSGLYLWGKRSLTPVILAHSLAVFLAEPFPIMLIFLAPTL
ncbi:CPBP family intramembrane metalloprotease [Chloroflexi bacterium TSY]|nr:CPBP family intramembrane metalloprotease [Chloroflexi bacterium TSY]